MQVAKSHSQSDAVMMDRPSPQTPIEYGSSYGSLPGDEFPSAIYRTVVFAFAWMMFAAWLTFGGATGTDLDLGIAAVLFTVFLGIPIVLSRTARNRLQRRNQYSKQFLGANVDIATGTISGMEAWLEVILIPVALALAATLIGGVYVFMS